MKVLIAAADYSGWYLGLALGFAVVAVVVVIVGAILALAARIADSAEAAAPALAVVRDQTTTLPAIPSVNDHAIAILNAAKTARKALTG